MTARDDFRRLAANHSHTKPLVGKDDDWFDKRDYTVRSTAGAAIVTLEEPCPVESSATAKIKYWADDSRDGIAHFVATSQLALNEAVRIGSPAIWGYVKDDAPHLNEFLDKVVESGACRRIRGENTEQGDFRGGTFYIADVDAARRWMNGR